MEIDDLISIGFVKNPIGNDGEFAVIPDKNFTEIFSHLSEVFFVFPDKTVRFETIQSSTKQGKRFRIKLRGTTTKSTAFNLKNAKLMLAPQDIDLLSKEKLKFYKIDGYQVFTIDDKLIGVVDHILSNPTQKIISITRPNGKEIMIPLVEQFIQEINYKNRSIKVTPPEGLLNAH